MFGMSELSDEYKFPKRSIAEVKERFDDALLAHQKGRKIRFRDRNMTGEAFINAVVMHFLDLGFEGQRKILEEYVPRFEGLLGRPEPASPPALEVAPVKIIKGSTGKRGVNRK